MVLEKKLKVFDKNNPFFAQLIKRKKLTLAGSTKQVEHYEIDIKGSNLTYTCGDYLGIYPNNCIKLIKNTLQALKCSGKELVLLPKMHYSIKLEEAFLRYISITKPTRKIIQFLAQATSSSTERKNLEYLLKPSQSIRLKEYLSKRELHDLIIEHPNAKINIQTFINKSKRLVPRLYSIASSPKQSSNTIHIVVTKIQYLTNKIQRNGVASNFLSKYVSFNKKLLPIFVAKSNFRLPKDNSKDIIMIGVGTGIAPFRGFLQERYLCKAIGRQWLFFGERNEATDFLYKNEWKFFKDIGILNRINVAFSRDHNRKFYIQDCIMKYGKDIWSWIKNGAYLYVCGDAKQMAPSVEKVICEIFKIFGKMSAKDTKMFVKHLKKTKNYQKDVY